MSVPEARGVILVAVGANLPDRRGRPPLETCRWAVGRVAALAELRLDSLSGWWCSAPVPPSGQPDYVNGVARFSGPADPAPLLAVLHAVEAEAGRVRSLPNAARPLDLDLLAVDDVVVATPGLVLPHPRLAERGFVVLPLAEAAPGWRHPNGETMESMLARVDRAGLRPLVPGPVSVVDLAAQQGPS